MCMCRRMCVYIYIYIYIHVAHIYRHIYIHRSRHIYTYTPVCSSRIWRGIQLALTLFAQAMFTAASVTKTIVCTPSPR